MIGSLMNLIKPLFEVTGGGCWRKLTANSIIGRLLDPLNDNGDRDDDDADPDDEDNGEDDFDDDGDEDNGDDEDDDGSPTHSHHDKIPPW